MVALAGHPQVFASMCITHQMPTILNAEVDPAGEVLRSHLASISATGIGRRDLAPHRGSAGWSRYERTGMAMADTVQLCAGWTCCSDGGSGRSQDIGTGALGRGAWGWGEGM